MIQEHTCPCGSEREYSQCCGPCLNSTRQALTAEQLMRSRYTAYVLQDKVYLLQSWHPTTRPQQLELHIEPAKWIGLKIVATLHGQVEDTTGMVEFIARYKINGKAHRLHEKSDFIRDKDVWFYVEGINLN